MKTSWMTAIALGVILVVGGYLWNLDRRTPTEDRWWRADIKETDWKEFRCEEGGYKIEFPGTPLKRRLQDWLPEVRNIQGLGWELHRGVSPKIFFGFFHGFEYEKADATLDLIAEGLAQERKAKNVSVKNIELNGHPGREVVLEVPYPGEVRIQTSRYYLVGRRYYHTAVVASTGEASGSFVSRFLDSFALVDK